MSSMSGQDTAWTVGIGRGFVLGALLVVASPLVGEFFASTEAAALLRVLAISPVLKGFTNSGADWLARYKKYINDGATVVASPHKVYGPESNDLALQLRKRGIQRVILAGMSANLCVESHLRELLEQGFEVAVVKDATAAAIVPEGNGYAAALTNFRFLASAVWTTAEARAAMQKTVASK